jgi:hypothetical protein
VAELSSTDGRIVVASNLIANCRTIKPDGTGSDPSGMEIDGRERLLGI